MKHLLALVSLIVLITCKTSAQTPIWSVYAGNYVGKTVSFDEYVYDVSYNSVAKTFSIKLADPDVKNSPVITVVFYHIVNKKHISWLKSLRANH